MPEPVLDRRSVRVLGERASTGMQAGEFTRRFGGSCRTNHVLPLPVRRRAWLQLGLSIARSRVNVLDRRLYALPPRSELPPEFIRLDPWEASYLYTVAAQAETGIVEIGRLHGGSTFLLAAANMTVPIWSIDLAPTDDDRLRSLLDEHGLGRNVRLITGDSQNDPFPEVGAFDLLFVDGDHSYAGCTADLDAFEPRLAPRGHMLLHDSYQGSPVQQAVLDYLHDHELDLVRSPYIPAAHWHTSYGSLAHLRSTGASATPDPAASVEPAAAHRAAKASVSSARSPARRERIVRRSRVPIRVAAAAAVLAAIFMLLPEALGDWPYDPISHHAHHHALPSHQARPRL